MLKLGKGLKKKKKSKKNKHKDEELFTEEELEQYRREHQQKAAQESGESENTEEKTGEASEELQKFKELTAGVDDILRQTQGRLDRIKKESYFQRKPTPSDLKAQEEKERELQKKTKDNWIGFEEGRQQEKPEEEQGPAEENQEESESEYEFEENDDLFDTTYVDAIASGEVKLAYVPDDEEFDDGPDPFDTSTAEEILRKVEEEERKKKKQISLGIAVDVLTGRAERDKSLLQETGLLEEERGQVNKPRKRPRKIQDFSLLGSFDDNSNLLGEENAKGDSKCGSESVRAVDQPKSLLDDDLNVEGELPEGEALITEILVKQSAAKKEVTPVEETEAKVAESKTDNLETLLDEFDTVKENSSSEVRKLEEEDDFDEFTALAASSVINQKLEEELHIYEDLENDPFDTSVVNKILKEEKTDDLFGSVEGEIPVPATLPIVSTERDWSAFQKEEQEEPADPFDTTFLENIQPGKCELKLLENEILGDIVATAHKSDVHKEARILSRSNSDFDFNPREEETQNIPESVINTVHSKVSIHITDPSGVVETKRTSLGESNEGLRQLTYQHRDLLGGSTSDLSKLGDEPLPPNVESPVEDFSKYSDPFDTSIVEQVAAPGKAELKYIEKELLSDICADDKGALSDDEFDPRAEERVVPKVTFDIPPEVQSDLLSSVREEGARPLTPFYSDPIPDEGGDESEAFDFSDPFDTSHVISLPGKVEIKLIEKELESVESTQSAFVPLHKKLGIPEEDSSVQGGLKHSLSDQDFNPREEESLTENSAGSRRFSDVTGLIQKPPSSLPIRKQDKPDLFVVEEELPVKALTPAVEEDISGYIDPFDTSIAENIAPGKAELKVLEKELIVESASAEGGIKRSYTDPDFNPRDDIQEAVKPDISEVLGLPENAEVSTKPLTPLDLDKADDFDETDPFDTSIAANLAPGKAELRLLESELFGQ